ncbi:MAG: hypothetical protein RJB47_1054 [Pseudomonadota bacterium]|jgi:hypothetical protein
MHKLLFGLTMMINLSALAHDGHGLTGAHGHATDALGFVLALVVVAAMMWSGRK